MVAHSDDGSYSALYEVKIQPGGEVIGVVGGGGRLAATHKKRRQLLEPVVKLFDDKGIVVPEHSNLATARFFSRSKLYLWLNESNSKMHNKETTTNSTSALCYGYVLDTEAKSLVPFKSPQAHKPSATVISAFGKLYLLANPECWPEIPTPAFERYDPATNCWESLPPFPGYNHRKEIRIIGYAVCSSFILFTADHHKEYVAFNVTRKQWAFDVTRKQWHKVKVWPPTQYRLTNGSVGRGRAVVLGDTIYTFNYSCSSVVAFNFWWDLDEDGDVTFYVSPESVLKGLEIRLGTKGKKEGYLVHLGNLDFCLVQNFFQRSRTGRQEFCITRFQVVVEGGGRHIKTLHSTICEVDTPDSNFICLSYCLTADVDDIEPKEEERVITTRSMQQEEQGVVSTNELEETKQCSLFGTSDIPQELIFDILARLSTKDLIRLTCVSKAWNAAIQDPQLAKLHLHLSIKIINSLDPTFYILSSAHLSDHDFYPVALFNNNTKGRVVKVKHRSKQVQQRANILGYCNGLLCISGWSRDVNEYEDFGLWNPTIQKFKKIPLSAFSKFTKRETFYGLGYDSVNDDYKFVRLAQFEDHHRSGVVTSSEVQVYSLKSHSWKRIQDLPAHLNKDFELASIGVCVDGALHWLMRLRGESVRGMIVLTLHLTTEEYHWFSTPDYNYPCRCANSKDERKNRHCLFLQVLGGCLCFRFQCDLLDAWILKENGVAESWTKLYSTKELPELFSCQPLMLSECGKMVLFSNHFGNTFWFDLENKKRKAVARPDERIFGFDTLITCQTLHLLRRRPELPCNYCY
ncbi:putative F-box domain, kelch-type beta propeller, F-box associated interaction [Rosa chinensis]|uniref:Putative F-box domain, kelch-type beta propeller, F-box associated interaction n=1 Tax=Rosa chinensis TaxID=74649 RepID=A0A2P6P286_ROSCH|nr:putative F-box domain, kelch-type beta propeller, F-box associated interaction [Rosa chinensis]